MKFEILYEDEEIYLVNKPCGIAVQGGAGVSHPLDEEFARQCGQKIYLVHRLDRETSGILIVAKNPQSATKWIKLIQSKMVKKEYIAFCFNRPLINGKKLDRGIIEGTLESHGQEKSALTYFEVLECKKVKLPDFTDNQTGQIIEGDEVELSKIHLTLGTGRMHQLRIQLAKSQCPIIGDDLHGNFKLNKKVRKLGLKKLCLVSYRLTLPLGKKNAVFEIPLNEHMLLCENLLNGSKNIK